ncbi:hypothetical protein Pelo_8176 [Pelomyxa schiedti]|nr:hypothetical protein Pelo_8176 [Pelomyxa schiedti]
MIGWVLGAELVGSGVGVAVGGVEFGIGLGIGLGWAGLGYTLLGHPGQLTFVPGTPVGPQESNLLGLSPNSTTTCLAILCLEFAIPICDR